MRTKMPFFAIAVLIFVGCSDPKLSQRESVEAEGVWREVAYEMGDSLEGKRHGTWRFYDKDSVLIKEGRYDRGVRDGVWVDYYSNGRIRCIGEYLKMPFEFEQSMNLDAAPTFMPDTQSDSDTNASDRGPWDSGPDDGQGVTLYIGPDGQPTQNTGRLEFFSPEGKLRKAEWLEYGKVVKTQVFVDED